MGDIDSKGCEELIGAGSLDGQGFNGGVVWNATMEFDLKIPDLREPKILVILEFEATLGESETMVSMVAFEPGIPRRFTFSYSSKEGFESFV